MALKEPDMNNPRRLGLFIFSHIRGCHNAKKNTLVETCALNSPSLLIPCIYVQFTKIQCFSPPLGGLGGNVSPSIPPQYFAD
jgi:hypothetical protein